MKSFYVAGILLFTASALVMFQNFAYPASYVKGITAQTVSQASGKYGHLSSAHASATAKKYRLMVNNDGNDYNLPISHQSQSFAKQKAYYLSKRSDHMHFGESQVDAYVIDVSSGFGRYQHDTKYGEILDVVDPTHYSFAKEAIKNKTDVLQIKLEDVANHEATSKKTIDTFVSLRMNDDHDSTQLGAFRVLFSNFKRNNLDGIMNRAVYDALKTRNLDTMTQDEFTQLTYQYDSDSGPSHVKGRWASMSYGGTPVRQQVYNVFKEILSGVTPTGRYKSLDGIVLDFTRAETFFRQNRLDGSADQGERDAMTELMRNIRVAADQQADIIGHPLKIVIVTSDTAPDGKGDSDSLDYNHWIGLDLAEWAKEKLYDIQVGNDYRHLGHVREMEAWAHSQGLQYYTNLGSPQFSVEPADIRMSDEGLNGEAAFCWSEMNDGVYMMNPRWTTDSDYSQFGDKNAIEQHPRLYFVSPYGHSAEILRPDPKFFHMPLLTQTSPVAVQANQTYAGSFRTMENNSKMNSADLVIRVRASSAPRAANFRVTLNNTALDMSKAVVAAYPTEYVHYDLPAGTSYSITIPNAKAYEIKYNNYVNVTSATATSLEDIYLSVK